MDIEEKVNRELLEIRAWKKRSNCSRVALMTHRLIKEGIEPDSAIYLVSEICRLIDLDYGY